MRHLYDVGGEELRGASRETRGKAEGGKAERHIARKGDGTGERREGARVGGFVWGGCEADAIMCHWPRPAGLGFLSAGWSCGGLVLAGGGPYPAGWIHL
jgi:hypothetical protein